MSQGDWWCPQCEVALPPQMVTCHERCDTCGTPVCLAGCGHEAELARLQGADAAWQASEARVVGICQLLGIDYTLEEPERIEGAIARLQAELAALRAALNVAEGQRDNWRQRAMGWIERNTVPE